MKSMRLGSSVRYGSLAQILYEIINSLQRRTNCHISFELLWGTRFGLQDLAGIRELQVFKVVTVLLCHPAWQAQHAMWHHFNNATDLLDCQESCDKATKAVKLLLEQGEKGRKLPEVTVTATEFFICI